MIAVVAEVTSGAVAVYVASLVAARAGVLDVHLRKPPKPRKPPEATP